MKKSIENIKPGQLYKIVLRTNDYWFFETIDSLYKEIQAINCFNGDVVMSIGPVKNGLFSDILGSKFLWYFIFKKDLIIVEPEDMEYLKLIQ